MCLRACAFVPIGRWFCLGRPGPGSGLGRGPGLNLINLINVINLINSIRNNGINQINQFQKGPVEFD